VTVATEEAGSGRFFLEFPKSAYYSLTRERLTQAFELESAYFEL